MKIAGAPFSILIVGFLVLAAGCGDGPSQATPRDTLRAFGDVFIGMDEEGTCALLSGSDEEMRAASALMKFLAANIGFRDDFKREYGAAAWDQFQDEDGARLTSEITDQREKIESMEIAIDGDKAIATLPGEPEEMHLVRVDGRWFIRAADIVGGGALNPKQVRQWEELAATIEKHRARIGQAGVEPEQLDRELGEAVAGVLGL